MYEKAELKKEVYLLREEVDRLRDLIRGAAVAAVWDSERIARAMEVVEATDWSDDMYVNLSIAIEEGGVLARKVIELMKSIKRLNQAI